MADLAEAELAALDAQPHGEEDEDVLDNTDEDYQPPPRYSPRPRQHFLRG
jgi:hypothetical protein